MHDILPERQAGADGSPAALFIAAGEPDPGAGDTVVPPAAAGTGEAAAAPAGPVEPAPGQPAGALSGRVVFCSAGHGWTYDNGVSSGAAWFTQRAETNDVVEDYGNLDQMALFATYCFNAGATVVPLRPVGFQPEEVVLDNISAAVSFEGAWSVSGSTVYFGAPGQEAYRFAALDDAETATATYVPDLPSGGDYPVYTWVLAGSNRTDQLYRVRHLGGVSAVRVPHHKVGGGWVYLGTYPFGAGADAARGAVVISNRRAPGVPGTVVIADAVRFGNGMGDVLPAPGGAERPGVSGYPREEECARYWAAAMRGQGQPTSLYDGSGSDASDNVSAPPKVAREMNRAGGGGFFDRVFLSFHSNAGGGRGTVALYNDEALFPGSSTPNQRRLAEIVGREVNDTLAALAGPGAGAGFGATWSDRSRVTFARSDFAFGEIHNRNIDDEFDATILEVGFHDDPGDALLLREPLVRAGAARAAYRALVRYFNEFDGLPTDFLPDPPFRPRAAGGALGVQLSWSPPALSALADRPEGYIIYHSADGRGFSELERVAGESARGRFLTGLERGRDHYFRLASYNRGGVSTPSRVFACGLDARTGPPPVLLVDAFDRLGRAQNPRQTAGPGIGSRFGGTATFDRVIPQRANPFRTAVAHGRAVAAAGLAFDSCPSGAVGSGAVDLGRYALVVWMAGEESSADESFSGAEQVRVAAFAGGGGHLFVSGSEVAWDLGSAAGASAADRAFLRGTLRADLASAADDDAGTTRFAAAGGGLFSGLGAGDFGVAAGAPYDVDFPDVLTPVGGGIAALSYRGGRGGAAAVQHPGSGGSGRLVFLGFPFETVTDPGFREGMMAAALGYFGLVSEGPGRLGPVTLRREGTGLRITWGTQAGRRYRVEFRQEFGAGGWVGFGSTVLATGPEASVLDPAFASAEQRFYRVSLLE